MIPCPKCLTIVEELVHDAGDKICLICSGKNYWNKNKHSEMNTWEDVKKHLEKKY